jgi:quercetin dioxygenase-like cupin family protein
MPPAHRFERKLAFLCGAANAHGRGVGSVRFQNAERDHSMQTFAKMLAASSMSLAAIAAISSPALAGECPAGKMRAGAVETGPMAPVNVKDEVIASIDLGKGYGVPGRMLRMRRLVVQPGGVVPWHSHAERPANIYIISGEISEYRSDCEAPIVHRGGDVVAEQGDISHYWRNDSKRTPTVLISADIPPAAKPEDMGM